MPTTIAEMARRIRAFDITEAGRKIIESEGPLLTDYNRFRLQKGLGVDGNHLSPKHSEDPYFKTKAQAYGYAKWKQKINRGSAPFDVPTFTINNYTHNRIRLFISGQAVSFKALVPWGDEIQRKTGGQAFGLSEDDKYNFRKNTLHPALARALAAATGAKIG